MRFVLLLALFLSGCGSVDYDQVTRGKFSGSVYLVWVGPGNTSWLGDGHFIYVPMPGKELRFKRDPKNNPSGDSDVITPEAFYTDGGSIPRSVQALDGFNAWGFGPAYVIHDWLFVAKKCLNDEARYGGKANDEVFDPAWVTDEMRRLDKMTFTESARVMAETIKTLTRRYDVDRGDGFSGPVISSVTAGPVSHGLWTEVGACKDQQIKPEHRELIVAPVQKGADMAVLRARADRPRKLANGEVAFVVETFSFD